jgi:hypothetical protein
MTLVVPGARVRRRVAVPLAVTHTVPSTAESSQWAAAALQNTTWPAVSGVPLEVTVAVIVTTEPAVTPAGDTASVVVVALAVTARAGEQRRRRLPINMAETSGESERLRRMFFLAVKPLISVMIGIPQKAAAPAGLTRVVSQSFA